ncbi:serine hydrolase [Parasphingopyxis sp.]|uniref:serine hydrolase domain-containing protein n=1 Tax=Parasphingopyxis sp. TaxID=1920299 RepID=UPI00262C2F09|nr:serine hydrolase domain-containing protein [Parasphingopyxis sp.]
MTQPDAADLQVRIELAAKTAHVPGLAFAVSLTGEMVSAATGVVNIETGVEVLPDSLFQIGSITKSHTATLAMQAAEDGLIDIDAPVSQYIPIQLGRGPEAGPFTARQLMAHISGLDGDLFIDTGRDDDALARLMVLCKDLDFLTAPGRYYSYSSAGYAILGRMLEVVYGQSYEQILKDRLLDPIEATRSTCFAENAAFCRTSVGHEVDEDGKARVVSLTLLPRAMGAAGLSLFSTVEELIAYANVHIFGHDVLNRASAEAMRAVQTELPDGSEWGLGWKAIRNGGTRFVGHDGGTIGQAAALWFVPEHELAIAMCANGGDTQHAWQDLAYPIFQEVCGGVPEPDIPEPVKNVADLSRYVGVYDNIGVTMHVTAESDRLKVVAKSKFFGFDDVVFPLHPIGEGRFRCELYGNDKIVNAFFDPDEQGRPALFYAGRLHRRVDGAVV